MPDTKPQTFDIKKCKRWEAKKRKLEAFLNLVRSDDSLSTIPKKKPSKNFAESYKALQEELKKYKKKKDVDPLFYPVNAGKSAIVKSLINNEELSCISPIFVEDVHHLLLKSVLGNISPFTPRWAKLEGANRIAKTVFIEIDGLSERNVVEMNAAFKEKFPLRYIVDVVSSDTAFATELSTLHLVNNCHSQLKRSYSSMFPVDYESVVKEEVINEQSNVSKLHLLLSPIQLALENFPLPQNIFEQSKSDGYCFTKHTYNPVHADSPMFAVDCEMCRTVTGKQEVTRVAIVNESLETVYHTLVKPEAKIVDYVTRFSGITEKMLRNVKTTLRDVQRDMQRILPSDAILCGQSLNFDLHGLKMIHPYIIDTSVIYNEKGERHRKTSLKQLAQIHLKESIQDGKRGHNPIEDSIATMKLVQLKLKNSVKYGDAVLSADIEEDISHTCKSDNNSNVSTAQNIPTYVNLNPGNTGFFPIISRFSKKVCLIGSENSLGNYCQETITDNVTRVNQSSLEEIMKATVDNLEKNDFVMGHVNMNAENSSVTELNDKIKELFDSLPHKTSFIIFMSDIKKLSTQSFKHNFCMITLKN